MVETAAWCWGDLFELELPVDWGVHDLGDAVELHPAGSVGHIHLAVLGPIDSDPEHAVRDAIGRFAGSHGVANLPAQHVDVMADGHGVATGRLAFVAGDTAWLVLALAWNAHLVLAFATAPHPDEPVFDHAEALLRTLRPLEVVSPRPPTSEPAGDF